MCVWCWEGGEGNGGPGPKVRVPNVLGKEEGGGKRRRRSGGRGRASTSRGAAADDDKEKLSLSLSLFLTCCRSLAALAMTLPYMAEFIVDSNLSLFCFFVGWSAFLGGREGEDQRRSMHVFHFIVTVLFFFFFFLSTLAFLALSVSRVLSSLIEQAHHVIHDGQTLTRRHEEKRERESRKETKAEE